jgi:hypothetical protein
MAPVCKKTVLAARNNKHRRWQDTQACMLCRDEGTDCDKALLSLFFLFFLLTVLLL